MFKAVLLVLLLAGGLRFTALTFESLWLDESYQTVVESYGNVLPDLLNPEAKPFIYKAESPSNVKDVLAKFRQVDPLCPPLFAILINRWVTIFGGSDFALRAFSVICSILSIGATYLFGRLLLGKPSGLCAALIQAISPFDICYAQEARMYSLCTLLAIIAGGSLLYLCLRKEDSKRTLFAVFYVISTWALINTHYAQIFLWAFCILVGLAASITRKDWRLFTVIVVSNLAILILCLPWTPLFLQAASLRHASFYVTRPNSLIWPIWALIIRIPFNWLTFLSGKKVMVFALGVYLTSFIFLFKYFSFVFIEIKKDFLANTNINQRALLLINSPLVLLTLWALLPALMIWLLDVRELHRVIEIPRYLISTAPAIYLMAGHALTSITKRKSALILILLHVAFALANNAYLHLIPQKENWQEVAHLLESKCEKDDLLFVSAYYNIVCLDRYLHIPLRQIGLNPNTGRTSILNGLRKEPIQNKSQQFWLLTAQEGDSVLKTLPEQFKILQSYDFPHAIHLRHYQYLSQ